MSRAQRQPPIWIVVAAGSYLEASIISGRLTSFGIPNHIHRESIGMVLGLSIGLGEAQVVVPEVYYEAARAILAPDDTLTWLTDGDSGEDFYDDDDQ
jgi:hypothetical protein